MAELAKAAHNVGECNLHLQITPAYRRALFADPTVRELTVAYILQKSKILGVHISAIECGPDHLHLFVTNWRCYAISDLTAQLKGYSSYMMRKGHSYLFKRKLWGDKFWSGGYFYRTVGVVTAETVKRYIEEGQAKHWVEEEQKQQTTLLTYTAL